MSERVLNFYRSLLFDANLNLEKDRVEYQKHDLFIHFRQAATPINKWLFHRKFVIGLQTSQVWMREKSSVACEPSNALD